MKKLFLISLTIFTTILLMASCGENGTGNATPEATAVESTTNATDVVKDTTAVK
jgi:hypothetical protein